VLYTVLINSIAAILAAIIPISLKSPEGYNIDYYLCQPALEVGVSCI